MCLLGASTDNLFTNEPRKGHIVNYSLAKMDAFFFEYRDFFSKRIKQMEADCIGKVDPHDEETVIDQQETSVCVRIRPLNETERDAQHVAGVIGHRNGAVNLYEPRRKINKKPDLNVCICAASRCYMLFVPAV